MAEELKNQRLGPLAEAFTQAARNSARKWWERRAAAEVVPVVRTPSMMGPDYRPMDRAEMMRALRSLAYDPKYQEPTRRVPMSALARHAGIAYMGLLRVIQGNGELGPARLARLSMYVPDLMSGALRCVKVGKDWVIVESGKAPVSPQLKHIMTRCPCGKYEKCPCGAVPVQDRVKGERDWKHGSKS